MGADLVPAEDVSHRPDLPGFLLARWLEDAQHAQGAGLIAWLTYRRPDGAMHGATVAATNVEVADDPVWVANGVELEGWHSVNVVFDQRKVLADIGAKQRILNDHMAVHELTDTLLRGDARPSSCDCHLLRCLALPYAAHPDYRPEWSVTQ